MSIMSGESKEPEDTSEKTPCSDLIRGVESDGEDDVVESKGSSPGLVGVLLMSQALENYHKGKRGDYDFLVYKLGDPYLKPLYLQRYLKALKGCVSLLNKSCETLVGTVLRVDWASSDHDTVQEFIEFLTVLVSAQTYYLRACLKMLIKHFMPNVPKGKTAEDLIKEEQEQAFANTHDALQAVLDVVPMTPKFLLPVLSECFPYIKRHQVFQTSYVSNTLQVTWYIPTLRGEILELVINHITKIDVEVPKHELEDRQTEEDDATQFEVDLELNPESPDKASEESEMAAMLDSLMDILFKYMRDFCFPANELSLDSSTELFGYLVKSFEKVILPTHACCHIQFVMFYICSLDEVFTNSLLEVCWKKVANPGEAGILRQASAAYMASLVARAKYISISTVKTCLELLTHWVHCYIDDHDEACLGADVNKHGPFYSVCQSIFYIFVFRHRQCLETPEGQKFVSKLNFQRIVTCKLNPLKVCLPTVVDLFAQVTKLHQVVLCYTVIERNKRSMLPVSSAITSNRTISQLSLQNPLDSFFPFDPYLLRRSSKYVKPHYQEWKGVGEEHALLEDHQDDESEEEDDYMGYGKSPGVDIPDPTPDIAMSVSPGFALSPNLAIELEHRLQRRTAR
ncbi:RNA polymerase I-specific transcription initiation factor RRN3 [Nematostella vectensis]|uniref:RNA polymerase I-specific transcription initiation factor RRN3 n=1 Tax=Nematostella vectensis TaxID=45351 RepID=UPI0020777277|nr:RNA polymerase I-specific transcription initiation factor RRN3 [Nematostella vectensis]